MAQPGQSDTDSDMRARRVRSALEDLEQAINGFGWGGRVGWADELAALRNRIEKEIGR
jgi:hypothetical protein